MISEDVSAIRVVSLFAGGGFAEEALRLASEQTGIATEVVMAVDSWEPASRVRNANFSGVRTTVVSVKDMARDDLPPHDLVIGGPPCQPFSLAGKRAGHDDPRNCIPDFVRIIDGGAYLMENVRPRLLDPYCPGYWSEQFCAANFGDVTSRKRWFYSSHVLHIVPTPGPRRFGDIRDPEADCVAADRRADVARKIAIESGRQGRTYTLPPRGDGDFIGSLGSQSDHRIQSGSTLVAMRSYPKPFTGISNDGVLGSVMSHTHDQPLRAGQSRPTQDDDVLGSLTSGKGGSTGFLKVGLRGHSASAFEDDEVLGSLVSNSWHGNEIAKLGPEVRCPSLLEMARAHSIPDSWNWAGVTKTQRGQITANGWPIGMGVAVCAAMLSVVAASRERAA